MGVTHLSDANPAQRAVNEYVVPGPSAATAQVDRDLLNVNAPTGARRAGSPYLRSGQISLTSHSRTRAVGRDRKPGCGRRAMVADDEVRTRGEWIPAAVRVLRHLRRKPARWVGQSHLREQIRHRHQHSSARFYAEVTYNEGVIELTVPDHSDRMRSVQWRPEKPRARTGSEFHRRNYSFFSAVAQSISLDRWRPIRDWEWPTRMRLSFSHRGRR